MTNLYTIEDNLGEIHIMSAKKIHQKVLEDSKKSNYKLFASSSSLYEICNKSNFPKEYALDIKLAILNSFSYTLNNNRISYEKNKHIIYKIYNSLYNEETKKAIESRVIFLNSFIMNIFLSSDEMFFLGGPNFTKVCEEWQNKRVKELIKEENIDFVLLRIKLEKEYISLIKESRNNGVFAEDAKIEAQRYTDYLESLKEKNIIKK